MMRDLPETLLLGCWYGTVLIAGSSGSSGANGILSGTSGSSGSGLVHLDQADQY
jgi:hypothetical protein